MKHTYGGGYSKKTHSNNGGGGTAPKEGKHYTPLCRKSGYNQTMEAMGSRTRTQYPGTDKHNQWEGVVSKEEGGNVQGWSPE